MIELKPTKEKAILVALKTKDISKETVSEHLDELEELAYTAGADTVFKIVQDKQAMDSAFYIGRGKAEEIAQLAELNDISLVIFDDDLTPVQIRNLEKLINRKIVDRSALILDIFAGRAKTKEAKTQVELAQLQYMMPRLTRAWTHLSKQFGGIGTKGPGETQIETDRRIIKERIALLKDKLDKIESQRITQTRKRKDFVRISLIGYTNAGKSTLFNMLTKENILAENKLFATLDSTTRTLELEKNLNVLISDTVGFIRKLPHHLVASFKSTLNEVRESDILLHIIDISNDYYEDHIEVVNSTLKDLECAKKQVIKIFNKIDLVQDINKIQYLYNKYPDSLIISAFKGINISSLRDKIKRIITDEFSQKRIKLKITDSKLISLIHSLANVTEIKYTNEFAEISYTAKPESEEKIRRALKTKS
ncbi:MAG TPA: GTPase HflX [Ignavibacteriaceae bacterium]|nr:GTPase HflX [Ignavibacteriaceae bacterium]